MVAFSSDMTAWVQSLFVFPELPPCAYSKGPKRIDYGAFPGSSRAADLPSKKSHDAATFRSYLRKVHWCGCNRTPPATPWHDLPDHMPPASEMAALEAELRIAALYPLPRCTVKQGVLLVRLLLTEIQAHNSRLRFAGMPSYPKISPPP